LSGRLVVFDLDGTLVDGYAGIADALGYAMVRLKRQPLGIEQVRRMVGRGIETLLEEAVGRDAAPEGVRLFRSRYDEVAVSGSRLLPGLPRVFEEIAAAGWKMSVASNKPSGFSRRILEAKGVATFFVEIAGPDDGVAPKPDPAMLRRILDNAGILPEEAVVVGDMEIDAQFARAGGCRIVLVPGGSRTPEELAAAHPDALLADIRELPACLASLPAPADGVRKTHVQSLPRDPS